MAQPKTVLLNIDEVELSFFLHPYPMVQPLVETENLRLASLADIGCMKLSAIIDRHKLRDYIDLYAICQSIPLAKLLRHAEAKFQSMSASVFLRALEYYADVEEDRKIEFKNNFFVDLKTIESFFRQGIPTF